MIFLALTGGIASGKSTVAAQFARLGVPVFNADRVVHGILAGTTAVSGKIHRLFPDAVREGEVDRAALGRIVFADPQRRAELEAVLHPEVRRCEERFRRRLRGCSFARMALCEIPLLFETEGENRFDAVLVTQAPLALRRARAQARPGMTAERFEAIRACQMPASEQVRRADFVIHTGLGKAYSMREVLTMHRKLLSHA
jgi:dephospho-CoA kinase